MTLVEVLAALVILGSVLALLITARARHLRQEQRAQRTLEAVSAADALLVDWSADFSQVQDAASGELPNRLTWRTEVLAREVLDQPQTRLIRLTIAELRPAGEALCKVDLVLPSHGKEEVK